MAIRSRTLLTFAVGVLVLVGLVATWWVTSGSGSEIASAKVGGLDYSMTAARTLRVPSELIRPHIDASSVRSPLEVDGKRTLSIVGIDPTLVLLMKLAPGAHDDAGPLGEFVVLVRGNGLAQLCQFLAPDEGLPASCR